MQELADELIAIAYVLHGGLRWAVFLAQKATSSARPRSARVPFERPLGFSLLDCEGRDRAAADRSFNV